MGLPVGAPSPALAANDPLQRDRLGHHDLAEQAVEEQATVAGAAAIEAERLHTQKGASAPILPLPNHKSQPAARRH